MKTVNYWDQVQNDDELRSATVQNDSKLRWTVGRDPRLRLREFEAV